MGAARGVYEPGGELHAERGDGLDRHLHLHAVHGLREFAAAPDGRRVRGVGADQGHTLAGRADDERMQAHVLRLGEPLAQRVRHRIRCHGGVGGFRGSWFVARGSWFSRLNSLCKNAQARDKPPTTSHQPRATNYGPRTTNHEPRITKYHSFLSSSISLVCPRDGEECHEERDVHEADDSAGDRDHHRFDQDAEALDGDCE